MTEGSSSGILRVPLIAESWPQGSLVASLFTHGSTLYARHVASCWPLVRVRASVRTHMCAHCCIVILYTTVGNVLSSLRPQPSLRDNPSERVKIPVDRWKFSQVLLGRWSHHHLTSRFRVCFGSFIRWWDIWSIESIASVKGVCELFWHTSGLLSKV